MLVPQRRRHSLAPGTPVYRKPKDKHRAEIVEKGNRSLGPGKS